MWSGPSSVVSQLTSDSDNLMTQTLWVTRVAVAGSTVQYSTVQYSKVSVLCIRRSISSRVGTRWTLSLSWRVSPNCQLSGWQAVRLMNTIKQNIGKYRDNVGSCHQAGLHFSQIDVVNKFNSLSLHPAPEYIWAIRRTTNKRYFKKSLGRSGHQL